MAIVNAIRKTPDINGMYEYIENVQSTQLDTTDWEISPDVSTLEAADIPQKHWKYDAPNVFEMTNLEKLAVNKKLVPEFAQYIRTLQQDGRFYCYTDNRWIASGDDNYGLSYYQFTENSGTADNPIMEWEHQGVQLEKGENVRKLTINARANSNEITDVQIRVVARYPTNPDKWRTGLSGDANMTNDVLLDDFFYTPTDVANWDLPFSGNMNIWHRRSIMIDYEIPTDGWVSIYVRPVGTLTANRYLLTSMRWDIIGINPETSA